MLIKLFPEQQQDVSLHNLYLDKSILPCVEGRPCVYANYIASLDGRIALTHPVTGHSKVPEAIANEYDWRLFQELAAQADILITSGRYMRDLYEGRAQDELPVGSAESFDDLRQWRLDNNLPAQPAVAVLTSSLDLPWDHICSVAERKIYVVTTQVHDDPECEPAKQAGAEIIRAGSGRYVTGHDLVSNLYRLGYQRMYAIAGPMVLQTLIEDHVLNRLFLTQVHRLLGGVDYDTILQSEPLLPATELRLQALYLHRVSTLEQCFAIYDVAGAG